MNMTMNDRVLAALKATLAEPAEASGDLEEIANAKAVDVKPVDMSPKHSRCNAPQDQRLRVSLRWPDWQNN